MNSPGPIQSLGLSGNEKDEAPIAATFAGTLRAFGREQQLDPLRPRPLLAPTAALKKPSSDPGLLSKVPVKRRNLKLQEPEATAELADKAPQERKRFRPRQSQLIARAWNWLQKRQALSAKKQLRVSETVSLGEKRFIAVVQVEHQKFLIGGGSTGVSLLAELDSDTEHESRSELNTNDAAQILQPIACAGGRPR